MMFYPENEGYATNGEGFGESVFEKIIKAGHRTYFIDVRTTRSKDYFLVVSELRKKLTPNGPVNERSKVFVYQEDIEKFADGLSDALDYMRQVVSSVKKQ